MSCLAFLKCALCQPKKKEKQSKAKQNKAKQTYNNQQNKWVKNHALKHVVYATKHVVVVDVVFVKNNMFVNNVYYIAEVTLWKKQFVHVV